MSVFKRKMTGISLAVQQLRLCTSTAGAQVQSLIRKVRGLMLWGVAEKISK